MRIYRQLANVLAVAALVGCAADPGPAPIAEDTKNSTSGTVEATPEVPADKKNRDEIVVGIDPLSNGLNPHLIADDTAFVQSLANLVLPSAFQGETLNSDMLVSAEEVPATAGAKQTIRYQIREEAQWSDGAPITGADFAYLWNNLKAEPAAIDSAGYRMISNVRSENGGKVVYVDFQLPVATWRQLFRHLLPSHLFSIGTESFDKVLASTIPASGGKYMVRQVDRKRGVVELGRNDRFWGKNPAQVELLTFREVNSVTQAVEMLRNQQLAYIDVVPTETTQDALALMGGVETRTRTRAATLRAQFNTQTVPDETVRRGLASLIDVPVVARLSAGRSAELDAYAAPKPDPEAVEAAKAHLNRPIRIAADPADDQAIAAAQSTAALFRKAGFAAEVIATDFADLSKKRLPEHGVDLSFVWAQEPDSALAALSQFGCVDSALNHANGNLSQYCHAELEKQMQAWAQGGPAVEVAKLMQDRAVIVPIMRERRVEALGTGIQGPADKLAEWPKDPISGAIDTAAGWRKK
ncbi:ABC transporter family substrate-binding protein [Staphylococcus chromogenes]|nr:ABC transporter family substrate-binding protein [Staphylococcus chromogenes]